MKKEFSFWLLAMADVNVDIDYFVEDAILDNALFIDPMQGLVM